MSTLVLDRPLVVFDIESTGVNAQRDRIIELAAVRIEVSGEELVKTWLLNPGCSIPPETTAVHGITDEIVKDCPLFADKAAEIAAFFKDADLAGFNSDRFDVPVLEEEFARVGMNFGSSQRRHLDVQRIYHRMEPRDLTAAVRFYCNRDHAGAHGAEADARATWDVLKAQMVRYPDIPHTSGALDEWLVPHDPCNLDRLGTIRYSDGAWRINFGKKKGVPLQELFLKEKNFLRWIVNGNFDASVRAACCALLDHGQLPPKPEGV